MNFLRFLLPLAMVVMGSVRLSASAGNADVDEPNSFSTVEEERETDIQSVRDYVNSKRAHNLAEKVGNLNISGEIRAEWDHMKCRTDGVEQRGIGTRKIYPNNIIKRDLRKIIKAAGVNKYSELNWQQKNAYRALRSRLKAPYGTNEFSVEADLILDYTADRGWGTIKLQFDNPAGISEVDRASMINDSNKMMYGSGKMGNIALRKCFMGYNVWEDGTSRFDVEIGRRRLYDIFTSRIQFYSLFDGILAQYATSFDGVLDFGAKAGAFIVDSTVNHPGFVGELDFLNLADSGVDFKYSFITWNKHGINRFGEHHPYGVRFNNSQFTLGYVFTPENHQFKTKLYGAYLLNHSAPRTSWTHHKRANDAFYAGFTVGEVLKKGDWALDWFYALIQAQAISERDVQGPIERDNPRNITFYNRRSGGFANCKGWNLAGFYAISNNWTVNMAYKRISQVSGRIGGKHRSHEFSLTSIYAF